MRLAVALDGRRVDGLSLGVVSNAGFECVAVADSLRPLRLAPLEADTRRRLDAIFDRARIAGFVDVHHPLDLTPIAGDEAFAAAVEAVLDDPGVDVALVGCVPLTAALATLPDEVEREGGVTARLAALWRDSDKAWVAVVDSGALYDPFASALAAAGVPVFRSADRAARLLARYTAWRHANGRRDDA
jgi:acyl-CoA synthetase (NDP forming)